MGQSSRACPGRVAVSGSQVWQVSASRLWTARGRSGRGAGVLRVLGTVSDCGVSFPEGGVIHMACPSPQFRPDVDLPNPLMDSGSRG